MFKIKIHKKSLTDIPKIIPELPKRSLLPMTTITKYIKSNKVSFAGLKPSTSIQNDTALSNCSLAYSPYLHNTLINMVAVFIFLNKAICTAEFV